MKNRRNKFSARTLALFAAAILLMSTGGFWGTRAALNAVSPNGDATLETNAIDIDMVGADNKALDTENIMSDVEKVIPGRNYDKTVKVKNNAADAYVRVVVTKYWEDDKGEKTNEIEPKQIMLMNSGVDITDAKWTSDGGWIRSTAESTPETEVFYYSSMLKSGATSDPLFTQVRVNENVLADFSTKEEKVDKNHTNITYEYTFNGYSLCISAEAQAVQTHSAVKAMKSLWGVDVSMSGDSITGISK